MVLAKAKILNEKIISNRFSLGIAVSGWLFLAFYLFYESSAGDVNGLLVELTETEPAALIFHAGIILFPFVSTALAYAISMLREREEQYRDLFENANDLIQGVDAEGKFVYVNRKWREVLGYPTDEVEKMNFYDILREDQLDYCREVFERVKNGEELSEMETVFVTKNGKEIDVSGNISARFEGGKVKFYRGIFRDITQRRKAEEALIESEMKYRTLVDGLDDGVVVLDEEGKITLANIALVRILGSNSGKGELLGRSFFEFVDPVARGNIERRFREYIAGGELPELLEVPIRAKDGREVFIQMKPTLVREEGMVSGIRAVVRDTTERKRIERELENTKRTAWR